jgi:hypothetical protein
MGPALGVNLAEFEFPAYFNFFIYKKRCTLVVDSEDAEQNIRRVFSETLLGPAQFWREDNPIPYEEEDFAPDFPREAIPNFQKELEYFRIMPDGKELVLETLLNFRHFEMPRETGVHENLGVPPPVASRGKEDELPKDIPSTIGDREGGDGNFDDNIDDDIDGDDGDDTQATGQQTQWVHSQARWIGKVKTVEIRNQKRSFIRSCPHQPFSQVMSPQYGLLTRLKSKSRPERASAWKFSRCQVVLSTFCTTLTRTITLSAKLDSLAMSRCLSQWGWMALGVIICWMIPPTRI